MFAPPRAFAACAVNRRMLFGGRDVAELERLDRGLVVVRSPTVVGHGFSREMRSAAWSVGSSAGDVVRHVHRAVGDGAQQVRVVRGQQHRAARLLLRDDPGGEPVAHRPVEPLLGLVEHQQRPRPDEPRGEQQPAPLPDDSATGSDLAWSVRPNSASSPATTSCAPCTPCPRAVRYRCSETVSAGKYASSSSTLATLVRNADVPLVDRSAEHLQRPARRLEQPDHGAQHGRLARTVGADEGDDLAGRQRERHGCAHGRPAVADEQVLGADDGLRHVRQGIRGGCAPGCAERVSSGPRNSSRPSASCRSIAARSAGHAPARDRPRPARGRRRAPGRSPRRRSRSAGTAACPGARTAPSRARRPRLRSSRSTRASSNPSVVAASAPSRCAATVPSGASATSRQSPGALPRPTRPRSWCSCESPKTWASRITITVAAGTSTPTSMTVVDTSTGVRPEEKSAIARSFSSLVMRPCRSPTSTPPSRGSSAQGLGDLEHGAQRPLRGALARRPAPRRRSSARRGSGPRRRPRRPSAASSSRVDPRAHDERPPARARPPRAPGSTSGPSTPGCPRARRAS